MFYDRVVGDSYREIYEFTFKCELLNIANDKIRIHYWVPINDDDFRSSYEIDIDDDDIEPSYNKSTVFFWRSTGFSA